MNLSKIFLALILASSLTVSQKASAWDEKTLTNGIIAGAITKVITYALVKSADVSPNKAVIPGLAVGLTTVLASEGKNKGQEFVVGALTWALATIFLKEQQSY